MKGVVHRRSFRWPASALEHRAKIDPAGGTSISSPPSNTTPQRGAFMLRAIKLCLGVLALVAASCCAQAQQPIKIGVILPFSGQFADTGVQLDDGIKLYM